MTTLECLAVLERHDNCDHLLGGAVGPAAIRIAAEWASSSMVEEWILVGCYRASAVIELERAGIRPSDIRHIRSRAGEPIGHAHSHGDVSTEGVSEIVAAFRGAARCGT